MSTYYYLGCDKCKVRTGVIGTARAIYLTGDDGSEIANIYLKHNNHELRFFNEYDEDRWDYIEIKNYKELNE
jgi:hypothetical protein